MSETGRPFRALKSELLKPGMRVGLFGGTFDPVHEGHLHVARSALARLGLDRIWWVVTPQNPLKLHAPADFRRRLNGVREAAREPRMVVTDIEARLQITRTAELIDHIERAHRGVHFVWLMGADGLGGFHRWARWRDIAERVPICVVARPGGALAARHSRFAHVYSRAFLSESHARALTTRAAPCWTYLTEPLHLHASSAIRAGRQA